MNNAQKLLVSIGGTAELVAGYMGHYISDRSTEKKPQRQRKGQIGTGTYGKALMRHFDVIRGENK